MTDRKTSKLDFVGLHAHSGFSVFDGFGFPQDHMNFAYFNGMNAHALTDHGSMNGYSYQLFHAKEMKKKGKDIKPIFGNEMYIVESLDDWRKVREEERITGLLNKKIQAKIKEEQESGLVTEDEQETKSATKSFLNKRGHLVVLAMNQVGLTNLFRLTSKSYNKENFYRFPRIDLDLLREHNEGLIVSTACLGGLHAKAYWENKEKGYDAVSNEMRRITQKFLDIFGDRFYGEIQFNDSPDQHEVNHHILNLSRDMGFKVIATADSHYPTPDLWSARELYKRMNPKFSRNDDPMPKSVDEIGYELYPKNGDEMFEAFKKYSQLCGEEYNSKEIIKAIEETANIAYERIEAFSPDESIKLPSFIVPPGEDADEMLRSKAFLGLKALGKDEDKVYQARLENELDVIQSQKFSKYFLTMDKIVEIAKEDQLIGPARGSAGGCLLSYCLGITQIDPLKYDLLFERFLTRNASGYPDIDTDFVDNFALKEKLANLWGEESVVAISNVNTLKFRSLIKDVSKFFGIPYEEVNELTKVMLAEATPKAKEKNNITAGAYDPTYEELVEFSPSLQKFLEKYPEVAQNVDKMLGQIKAISRHASGVLVSDNLFSTMPVIASGGVRQTPWSEGQTVRHLEPLGFIKFDILGLTTLSMIQGAIRRIIKQENGKEPTFAQIRDFYNEKLHPDKINLNDQKVYQNVFQEGNWCGTFQFAENGAQQFCKKVAPKSIEEITAVTSIYRPGAMSSNVHHDYVAAKEAPSSIVYLHPILEELLKKNYGFILYQEDLANIAHRLGDEISLEEGNVLRKLLIKKGLGEVGGKKQIIYDKFVRGCLQKGITKEQADDLWMKMSAFASYSFNKSHAVAYSIISYVCAYLSTYYPDAWVCSYLDNEHQSYKEEALTVVRGMGYSIADANVNLSGLTWEIVPGTKRLATPLKNIKGLGDIAIEQIVNNRPFKAIEEVLFSPNIAYAKLNKKSFDCLIKTGALSDLQDARFNHLRHFWLACVGDERPKTAKKFLENIEMFKNEPDFSQTEKFSFYMDLAGYYPIDLVLTEALRNKLKKVSVPPISARGDATFCWFVIKELFNKTTKNGKPYVEIKATDDNNKDTTIRCWRTDGEHILFRHRLYVASLDFDEKYGYSTRNIMKNFKMLG